MNTITLDETVQLVDSDNKFWWETYAKTFVSFTPGRGSTVFRPDGYFHRGWFGGRGCWGTIKRHEVNDDGTFST